MPGMCWCFRSWRHPVTGLSLPPQTARIGPVAPPRCMRVQPVIRRARDHPNRVRAAHPCVACQLPGQQRPNHLALRDQSTVLPGIPGLCTIRQQLSRHPASVADAAAQRRFPRACARLVIGWAGLSTKADTIARIGTMRRAAPRRIAAWDPGQSVPVGLTVSRSPEPPRQLRDL